MKRDKISGDIFFSASDLADFIECQQLVSLNLRALDDKSLKPDATDEQLELIQAKGLEHEAKWLQSRKSHAGVVEIPTEGVTLAERFARVEEAMKSGADIIFQAVLRHGPFFGIADFLIKVDTPSRFGQWSYVVADTKLAKRPKARHLIQILFYSELLAETQGTRPVETLLVLGDNTEQRFRLNDYRFYFEALKNRFITFTRERPPITPERCAHCAQCGWVSHCKQVWADADHLNQVANITRRQIERLRNARITTLAELATNGNPEINPVPGLEPVQWRLWRQAALQFGARSGQPGVELIPNPLDDTTVPDADRWRAASKGFNRLPPSDTGDLYFDMEGDPLYDDGLEYLFGVHYRDGESDRFEAFWAHDRTQEKVAFERFIDFVMEHIKRHPGAHIYHYADYERRALNALSSLHATRQDEVAILMREKRLVDLYGEVVRHAILTSEPRYSIKNLEHFFDPEARKGMDVKNAGASIIYYERWREQQDPVLLQDIEDYNRVDCESTRKLHMWLLELRPQHLPWFTQALEVEEAEEKPRTSHALKRDAIKNERDRLFNALSEIADTSGLSTARIHTAKLLKDLLDFFLREERPVLWRLFDRHHNSDIEELISDADCLAGLVLDKQAEPVSEKQSLLIEYHFPPQDTKLGIGKQCQDVGTLLGAGTIAAMDYQKHTVTLKLGKKTLKEKWGGEIPETLDLIESSNINTNSLQEALHRVCESFLNDDTTYSAVKAILSHEPPDIDGILRDAPMFEPGTLPLDACLSLVSRMNNTWLVIQGPPGAGKTHTAAHLILDLVQRGKRVGVTSNSHRAIINLLEKTEEIACEMSITFRGAKVGSDDDELEDSNLFSRVTAKDLKPDDHDVVGGTVWAFAPHDDQFDYLFIDEAGQLSLAHLVACGVAAKNIVMLGDQMQLSQPLVGSHPECVRPSALEYALQGAVTVPPNRGIFLDTSYRMHDKLCRFISDAIYEGRLKAAAECNVQKIIKPAGLLPEIPTSGLHFHACNHSGCSQASREEANTIKELIDALLQCRSIDKKGLEHPITPDRILVVAPFNAQVRLLSHTLQPGIEVGTVDKFQGREADIVIVSMTASTGENIPRGIEFLFNRNRLNVALSRAKTLAIMVASEKLMNISCKTPADMAMVNLFCRVAQHDENSG